MNNAYAHRLKTSNEPDDGQKRVWHAYLASPKLLASPDSRPICVYTLGRFAILIEGAVLQFNGKSQRKPQELLKVLIALGSQDVRIERIIDCLWPDAPGDAAADVFKTTLYRLRKIFQNYEALKLNDHSLSLNTRYVWVDSLSIDEIAHDLKSRDLMDLKQALRIYQGPFLDGESMPWVLTYRDRLRGRYLATVEHLGTLFENAGDWPAAAEIYEQAVEAEPVAETPYRGLINSYLQLGRRAEALTVYQRCDRSLQSLLGIKPSCEIQALYQVILGS